jgi:arylsulfatase A-like enzyme
MSSRTQPVANFTPHGDQLNVLFIVSDQERGWHLYPTGFFDTHTPARAWLRDHGVHFTGFNTPTPICSTARGLIYSGLHSMNNGVFDNVPLPYASPLRTDVATLGTAFMDAGYLTGYAGKWHLSRMHEQVTDSAEAQANNATIRSYGFMETELEEESDGALAGWRYDARTVDHATRFMARHANDEQPWMLAVNLVNPHDIMYYTAGDEMTASRVSQFPDVSARPPLDDPLYAEDLGYELTDNYGPRTSVGRPGAVDEFRLTFDEVLGHMPFDDVDAGREMQNYYWNCTRDSDRHLQRLLATLRDIGQLERTIIAFTSDHGEMLGTHGMRGKGTTAFREASTVPGIIVHPHGRRGVTNDALLSHTDWMPTMLSLAGVPAEQVADQLPSLVGFDFSAAVFDDTELTRPGGAMLLHWTSLAYVEHRNIRRFEVARQLPPDERMPQILALMDSALDNRSQMRGVFDGRWKFQRYGSPLHLTPPTTFDELLAHWDVDLYDTDADPGEVTNLALHAEQWKEQMMTLNAQLNSLLAAEVGVDDGSYNPLVALRG